MDEKDIKEKYKIIDITIDVTRKKNMLVILRRKKKIKDRYEKKSV